MQLSPSTPSLPRPTARRRGPRAPRLVALGDLVLDVIVRPQSGLGEGTDVPGTVSFRAGGSAANTSRVFAVLGGGAWFVGAVGRDALAGRLIEALRGEGVRVHAARAAAPTARLVALLGPRGERSFVTQRGAADALRRDDLRAAWFAQVDVLHLPAYSLLTEPLSTAATWAATVARRNGALVSVDLASHRPLLARGRPAARALVAAVRPDVLFANRAEATALAGARGARSLLELSPVVVIKEGEAGCRVLWRAAADRPRDDVLELTVATTPIETIDTTGAGDAFDAGFLHSLAEQALAGAGRGGRQAPGDEDGAEPSRLIRRAHVLRRAAVAGHRAAARLLTRPRRELAL